MCTRTHTHTGTCRHTHTHTRTHARTHTHTQPNYLELPQPVRYEEIQREGIMVLKPDTFEGMRFEINKPINPYFFL